MIAPEPKTVSVDLLDEIGQGLSQAWHRPFRGTIAEYSAELNFQSGYAVRGQFDVNTVPHLLEPLAAIGDPLVRLVSAQGAVQTLKSALADITVPYWIEHDPGDILWLFEDDPKARLYAETRAMPLIRSKPSIYRLLEDVERNDKTKTKIRFSHCNLVIAGLNPGNVQSISYRYVIVDEAWMSRAKGLIREAMDRTRQFKDTKKIILLGQGGWDDEDHDKVHKQTDQRILTYACPFCGFRQPFDLARKRKDDHPTESLRGTYCGLSWDTNDTTKPDGRWNVDALQKSAHHRCYQCDGRIEDRPDIRRKLALSYKFRVTNPGAAAGLVGFKWPAEASVRIPFGELVAKYVDAKEQNDMLGYELPLQQFYQKDRGETWCLGGLPEYRAINAEPYDANAEWPEEAYRTLIVDCQKDLKLFWLSVFAVSKTGEARELKRGGATSFDEIAAIQAEHKVKDQHVFLDCGYKMTDVLSECIKRGHAGNVKVGGILKKVWLCWTGLKGSGSEMFRHENKKTKTAEWRIYSERKFYDLSDAGIKNRRAPWYEWSNLHAKDMVKARRDGDARSPKLRFLPDKLPDTDPWSHFQQMRSEVRVEKCDGGRKKAIWELLKDSRPNHEWDKASMLMVFMAIAGVIGSRSDEKDEQAFSE